MKLQLQKFTEIVGVCNVNKKINKIRKNCRGRDPKAFNLIATRVTDRILERFQQF